MAINKMTKKIVIILLSIAFLSVATHAKAADDSMQRTLRDSLYGGAIGALLGTALLFLTKHPGDHLEYIPTGAGIGILAGAAYGLATSGLVQSSAATEIENGKFTLNMPTVNRAEVYDEKLHTKEVIDTVDIVRVKF